MEEKKRKDRVIFLSLSLSLSLSFFLSLSLYIYIYLSLSYFLFISLSPNPSPLTKFSHTPPRLVEGLEMTPNLGPDLIIGEEGGLIGMEPLSSDLRSLLKKGKN